MSPRPGFVLEVDRSTPPTLFWHGERFVLEQLPEGSRVIYAPEPLEALRDPDAAIDFYVRRFPTGVKTRWAGRPALPAPNDVLLLFDRAATPPPPRPAAEPVGPAATGRAEPGPPSDLPPGAHLVVAPSPGIFWRSPQPGAPPFADIGDRVAPSSTLCIVEVMKMMNSVPAGVAGTIVEIHVQNAEPIEYGQPLFRVEPA